MFDDITDEDFIEKNLLLTETEAKKLEELDKKLDLESDDSLNTDEMDENIDDANDINKNKIEKVEKVEELCENKIKPALVQVSKSYGFGRRTYG